MKTYREWQQLGRTPSKGEHAMFYRVNPERTKAAALFSEDQTEPFTPDDPTLVDTLPVEEWTLIKQQRARPDRPPHLKIKPYLDGVAIWVGANKELIKIMQQRDYRFDRSLNRWIHRRRSLDEVVQKMREHGFEVEVEPADEP